MASRYEGSLLSSLGPFNLNWHVSFNEQNLLMFIIAVTESAYQNHPHLQGFVPSSHLQEDVSIMEGLNFDFDDDGDKEEQDGSMSDKTNTVPGNVPDIKTTEFCFKILCEHEGVGGNFLFSCYTLLVLKSYVRRFQKVYVPSRCKWM